MTNSYTCPNGTSTYSGNQSQSGPYPQATGGGGNAVDVIGIATSTGYDQRSVLTGTTLAARLELQRLLHEQLFAMFGCYGQSECLPCEEGHCQPPRPLPTPVPRPTPPPTPPTPPPPPLPPIPALGKCPALVKGITLCYHTDPKVAKTTTAEACGTLCKTNSTCGAFTWTDNTQGHQSLSCSFVLDNAGSFKKSKPATGKVSGICNHTNEHV